MLKLKKNIGLIIAVLISLIIFEAGSIGFDAADQRDVASSFIWLLSNGTYGFNGVFFAILAALPLSTSYVREYKSGYLSIVFTKQTKKKYILGKLVHNGLYGGIALAVPAIIINIELLLHYGPDAHIDKETTVIMFLKDWAVGRELVYVLLLIGIIFSCGVIFSTLALGISAWVKNSFLTLIIPFGLCILTAMFPPRKLNLLLLYSPNVYGHMSIPLTCVMGILLFVAGIVMFVTGVHYNEKNK